MKIRNDRGQATVITLVFLVVLLGMAALVLDIGSWYRADRATQSTADAAALAGAQALPYDTANARALATQYANKNGGGVSGGDITITSSPYGANDTIRVQVHRTAAGVFTKLFGVNQVGVGSKATARASLMQSAQYVAPIGVNVKHPMLKGTSACPCFGPGYTTTLPLGKTGAPGSFDLLNIDGSSGGTGGQILAKWILQGYSGYLPIGSYLSDTGSKWNDSLVQNALEQRMNTNPVLLFPVYDTLSGTGSNAIYHVVGWAAFHITGHSANGNGGSITGWFERISWDGIESTASDGSNPDLGVRVVKLID
ncbi:MAG TPA: pilus assembly protein TadG-related protein [Gaiellaceae bacterium]|nr:pilus assembly protein TadG-related protein [Gaiellaceae bacterium]